MCYVAMFLVVVWTHDMAGLPGFSFVFFVGSAIQFLAFLSLALSVRAQQTVAGISSGSMQLFVVGLSARVLTTTLEEGYLPSDASGDGMIQLVDAASLVVALYILYSLHWTYKHTYQSEHDTVRVQTLVVPCAVAALFVHGDLNQSLFFDSLWAFSLNIEVFQLLPQLHMFTKVGGLVDSATSHYVANMFAAAVCRFFFWVWALPQSNSLTSPIGYWAGFNMNMGGKHILAAYVLEILIHFDFIVYYVHAWWKGHKAVVLPRATDF